MIIKVADHNCHGGQVGDISFECLPTVNSRNQKAGLGMFLNKTTNMIAWSEISEDTKEIHLFANSTLADTAGQDEFLQIFQKLHTQMMNQYKVNETYEHIAL